ncbi:hypothetical protein ACVBIO_10275 [Shewanella sp. 0m-8]
MKKITQFDQIAALPLPTNIKDQLLAHLIEPFGDAETAQSIWDELGTTLYLIEHSDTDNSLTSETDDDQYFIQFVSDYPEWVFLLNDEDCPWLLALTITTSAGSGAYLCAPMNSLTLPVTKLAEQVEDSI